MKGCYKHGGKASDKHPAKPMMGGGDPAVLKKAKEKTVGIISGEPVKERMDKVPRRAMGGAVMAPAAANSPMSTAAKPGRAAPD